MNEGGKEIGEYRQRCKNTALPVAAPVSCDPAHRGQWQTESYTLRSGHCCAA